MASESKSMKEQVDEIHKIIVGDVGKPGLMTTVAIHGWALKIIGAVAVVLGGAIVKLAFF